MQKYLIFILIEVQNLCAIQMFSKKATTYTFQSLETMSKGQKATFLPVWLEQ